jgi:hypothetical protein
VKTRPVPAQSAATAAYARIVRAFANDANVGTGAGRQRGFGATALTVNGRIFAMLSSRERFVVKLPRARVDELVAADRGVRFNPGHGRLMKEWLEVRPDREDEWLGLAREARAFAAARP